MKKFKIHFYVMLALVLALLPFALPRTVHASAAESGEIACGMQSASAGETVELELTLTKNPGIVSCLLKISYDSVRLTFVSAEDRGLLAGYFSGDGKQAGELFLMWDGSLEPGNITKTGALVKLTFRVRDDAPLGTARISVETPSAGDIIGFDLQPVPFTFSDGAVNITEKQEPGGSQGGQGNQENSGNQGNQGSDDPGNQGSQGSQGGNDSDKDDEPYEDDTGCFGVIGAGGGIMAAVVLLSGILLKKRH